MFYRIWAFHVDVYEDYRHLRYNAVCPLKVNWRFGVIYHLHLQGRRITRESNKHEGKLCLPPALTLISWADCSSTLKMETICFSETSVKFQRTTRRYIPGHSSFYFCMLFSIITRFNMSKTLILYAVLKFSPLINWHIRASRPLPPSIFQEYSWYSFLLEAESTPE
jgi:hypothetical protein